MNKRAPGRPDGVRMWPGSRDAEKVQIRIGLLYHKTGTSSITKVKPMILRRYDKYGRSRPPPS